MIEIPLKRYDELIRTETKYNLLRNALEDEVGYYADIEKVKKCFGISNNRKDFKE